MIAPRAALLAVGLGALFAAAAGCAGGGGTGVVVATPVPTGIVSPTPGPCGTPIANGVFVAMASYITATTDPTYGLINGYALIDTNGSYGNVAEPISVRPGDTVQFVNVEPGPGASQSPIQHSAVSLQGSTFPTSAPATESPSPGVSASPSASPVANATPFPLTARDPIGNAISSMLWSTGRVTATASDSLCFSGSFTTSTQGTFAFGDYDYYTTTNMRDVIIVSATATRSIHRAPLPGTIHRAPASPHAP